jgi:hypothetical protein
MSVLCFTTALSVGVGALNPKPDPNRTWIIRIISLLGHQVQFQFYFNSRYRDRVRSLTLLEYDETRIHRITHIIELSYNLFIFVFIALNLRYKLSISAKLVPLFGWAYQHGLSVVEQYFSLTANQPQPAYKPKKQPAEQGHSIFVDDWWGERRKDLKRND